VSHSPASIENVVERILDVRGRIPAARSVLAAVSGIDGSGKGFVTARLVAALKARGVRVAGINIDGWLNLPAVRFHPTNPAEHFYLHATRFDDMFEQLVLPLRDRRSVSVETDFAEETATAFRRQHYAFADIDVVVLEGIYLLKRAFQAYYDLSVWLDCRLETALARALARGQEGLPPADTIKAYRTIYFPAQEIHFQRDDPQGATTMVVNNDYEAARRAASKP
jgi:uridine kinase